MTMSALIVVAPFASFIVSGQKTLELRSTMTRKLGQTIGIIEKATGTIIGVVKIVGSLGPLSSAELDELQHCHLVPAEARASYPSWRFGWELCGAIRLPEPIPYRHPAGAQAFVTLSSAETRAVQRAALAHELRGTGRPIKSPGRSSMRGMARGQ